MSTVVKDLGAVSAYAYAVEKGYTGTEAEFAELMADYAEVGQRAEDAAESALNSKTAAQTAATTATNKASEATTAATTATTKAGEASTSASTATSAKDTAVSASQTATTKATEATTAAGTAATAKNDAVTAKNAAETAQGKAETAQGAAEDAAESVSESAAQIATNAADISGLKEDLETLNTDGVAPTSKQMLSDNYSVDSVPYHFRKTASDNADREELEIVGGSVAWNQLAKPVTSDYWSAENNVSVAFTDSVATFTSQTANNGIKSNSQKQVAASHVYYMGFSFQSESASIITCLYGGNGGVRVSFTSETSMTGVYKIAKADASASGNIIYLFPASSGVNVEHKVKNVMLIDLTQMFGTTIADYVNGLETATAGAGVAFFKTLFPKDYYPYNASELVSVSGLSEHKMTGFNQWDEEWENGYINDNGQNSTLNTAMRSKNYIAVVPGSTYYIRCPVNAFMFLYDADKTFIGKDSTHGSGGNLHNEIFVIPQSTHYVRFCLYDTPTYNHDICVNISDPAKNGTYEPYKAHNYPLDSSLTLRGIPKLSDGKMYYDGDRYLPDGKVERRYGIRAYQSGDESLADAITDGTNTVYKLTTTTIEDATPYRQLQICAPNGTEEFVSTGIVPVGHNTKYPDNMRAKLDGLPWNFANLIAPTESGFKATRNYTTGALLIINNVLYKATANIANGGTITVGTNVTATTLADVIAALS